MLNEYPFPICASAKLYIKILSASDTLSRGLYIIL